MEFTFSKRTAWTAALLALVLATGYWFAARQNAVQNIQHDDQPALLAVARMYSPSGDDRDAWEQGVCANATSEGCDMFRFYYAGPLWENLPKDRQVEVTFARVAEELENGEQVWALNVQGKPVYIHVQQRADAQWALKRVLFEQEVERYETP